MEPIKFMPVGIDIVQINRIDISNTRFISKVLSKKEIELMNTKINKQSFVAGRFAAKEAFLKANKCGIFDMDLNKIEVLYDELHQNPIIYYENKKYENVSISHEKEYAIAIVII